MSSFLYRFHILQLVDKTKHHVSINTLGFLNKNTFYGLIRWNASQSHVS